MNRLIFLASIVLFLGNFTFAHSREDAKPHRIEVQSENGKTKKHGKVHAIVFRDSKGHELRKISFEPGEYQKKGRRFRRLVNALVSEKEDRVVAAQNEIDLDEMNPYTIKQSSSVHLTWYRSDGELMCEMQSNMSPAAISADGKVLVATTRSFDPVEFEKYHAVPGLQSTEVLKRDRALTVPRLYVINDSCAIVYSLDAKHDGWDKILLSPNGRWLALSEYGARKVGDEFHFQLTIIDIAQGKQMEATRPQKMNLQMINDDGRVEAAQFVGEGTSEEIIRTRDGRNLSVKRRKYRKFVLMPGDSAFKDSGEDFEK